ncbi:uncharacterized protein LOC127882295 isoform X2 [Dreissena polymorpha]|uniref:uncharacterized protein LOC127882295 isoform X2 n=1 Tax=Dreissena polymorpha TaxID=45954 RepID=UPI002264F76D|nr:uncharacterized protein LOC127882295 isoform X2 [Dreissena polymorpha]
MSEHYVLHLTEAQADEIRKFITDRKWGVQMTSHTDFSRMAEVAEDYLMSPDRKSPPHFNDRHKLAEVPPKRQLNGHSPSTSPPLTSDEPPAVPARPANRRSASVNDMSHMSPNAGTNLRSTISSGTSSFPSPHQSPLMTMETPPPSPLLPVTPPSGHSVQKFEEGLMRMREKGRNYNNSFKGSFSRGSTRKDSLPTPARTHGQWRYSSAATTDIWITSDASDIAFEHFLVADDNTLKVMTKLSTEHVTNVSRVPVRIVLLVDRSGSMLHKIGRDARHTKITKVKHFASQLIGTLDEGDQVAIVTFGEEAEVFFPLERLNAQSRPVLQEMVNRLDKGAMASKTNLSAGIRTALKVFYESVKDQAAFLESKNSILIFSDGEVNAGTTDAGRLVQEARQNIRQMVPGLDDTQSQWVTISVVTTGSSISEPAYLLSKMCSSEAYYYINKDSQDPEASLFLPVLLRKTAVAWNISYVIESFHDVNFDDNKCSRDHRVRLKRSFSARGPKSEKAYFMYDFPAGHARQLGVCANWNGPESIAGLADGDVIFKLRVEYTNIKGERFWQEQEISKEDLSNALSHKNKKGDASAAACKHELQMISTEVLSSAAEFVKSGDKQKSRAVMQSGQRSLQALMDQYGASSITTASSEVGPGSRLACYAKSVAENLGALISSIEKATAGESWNKMKAVSTAIARESPNTAETVVGQEVLCPFPEVNHMESDAMRQPLERAQAEKKKQHRLTFGIDRLLEEQLAGLVT